MPIWVIMAILMDAIIQAPTMEKESISNMIVTAFFYCMRSDKYTGTTSKKQAFALEDITFYIGLRRLDNETCTDLKLEVAQ